MVKTQVQIPDELYRRAKEAAKQREWSFAEIVRRGLEYITMINPPGRTPGTEWHPLKPANMGKPLVPEEEWTAACHN